MSDLETLIAALSGKTGEDLAGAQYAITKYLRDKVHSDREDWLNDYSDLSRDGNCPLPVDGAKCVNLLGKCLSVKSGDAASMKACTDEWNGINFSGGVDVNKMDLATARNLVNKMGISDGNIKKWVSDNGITVSPSVVAALTAIVARVKGVSGRSEPSRPSPGFVAIFPRVAVTPMPSSGMIGGGGNNAVANFVQMSNYLKNRFTLIGGNPNAVPSSVAALRSSLLELENVLKAKGKAIDSTDKQRIIQLIDGLQSTEEKADKAAKYMIELRRLIAHPKFDVAKMPTGNVTAEMMAQLTEQHKALLAAATKKSYNLLSIFETIAAVADDVRAIKAKVTP